MKSTVVDKTQVTQQTSGNKNMILSNEVMQYHMDVLNVIKTSWRIPGKLSSKKDLLAIILIRIRKDGKIVDFNMEKSSGNKIYDESIIRALRAAEPLPAIPAALNTDFVELGFRFIPDTKEEESSKQ